VSRAARALPWVVAGLVAVAGAWGLDARDLAGDEVHMLVGDPVWIGQRALDPRGGFVGHLPWSYWLRWLALTLFGDGAWAWRLHAVVGAALAAGLTARLGSWRLGDGPGAAAGLLVGLCPVLAFHAQDSSNYAWSAATGALVLGGLWGVAEGRKRAALWLGAGLLIGGLNDVYFVFLGATAAAASVGLALRRPTTRRALAAAWVPSAVILLPAAMLFGSRLLESQTGAVVDVHADLPAPSELPWAADVPWRVLRRFFGSTLAGYAAGRIDAPWEVVAPVGFGVLGLGAAARGRGRGAAAVLGGALLLVLGTGLAFRGLADRTLPHEPRAFLTLLPALACVWVAALQRLPRPVAMGGAGLLLLSLGSPLVQQMVSRSTMHRDAAALAASAGPWMDQADLPLRDLHVVVPDRRIRARLPRVVAPMGPGVRASEHDCVPDDAGVVVFVRNQPLDGPATRPGCGGGPAHLSTHTLLATTSLGPPAHERNAASFLMPVQVEVWWPGDLPAGLPVSRALPLASALLDGAGPATQATVWTGMSGGGGAERVVWAGPLGDTLAPVPLAGLDEQVRVVLTPPARALPATALLDPLRREVQSTESSLVAPLTLGGHAAQLVPLRAPAWQVLLRLARIGLALLAGLALFWPRRDP
jgi:hypothetical protein